MASEDFSYVLQRVPGAMMEIGARPADPRTLLKRHRCTPTVCSSTRMYFSRALQCTPQWRCFHPANGRGAAPILVVSDERSSCKRHGEAQAPNQNESVYVGFKLSGEVVVLTADIAFDLAKVDVFTGLTARVVVVGEEPDE
jgi:hypothetical protein